LLEGTTSRLIWSRSDYFLSHLIFERLLVKESAKGVNHIAGRFIERSVQEVFVTVKCGPVVRLRGASFLTPADNSFGGPCEICNASLGCEIEPAINLQYRTHNGGCRNWLPCEQKGRALMGGSCQFQGATPVALEKVETIAQPIVGVA